MSQHEVLVLIAFQVTKIMGAWTNVQAPQSLPYLHTPSTDVNEDFDQNLAL